MKGDALTIVVITIIVFFCLSVLYTAHQNLIFFFLIIINRLGKYSFLTVRATKH